MLSLVWFKRDLRVADHPALIAAAARGPVLPLYIVEPDLWAQPDTSGRQWDFVAECLADLRRDLADLGQPLLIRVGGAVSVLDRLHKISGFSAVFSHEESGSGWSCARNRQVAAWARLQGVEWHELPQSGVARQTAAPEGRTARREAFMAQPVLAPPALTPVAEGSGAIPSARSLRLADDRCAFRQKGGRDQAVRLLDSFLDHRGQLYRGAMSSPEYAERGCSRLSPYLAFGAVSVREVAQARDGAQTRWCGQPGWGPSLRSFGMRLAWRDHFIQKLADEPTLEHRALHPALENLRPAADQALLGAWQRGETGLPFVDACMRYLHAAGWLNFRMRAMLVSVASYHLWLDWRATGPFLARQFTDYESGIHWSQMQLQSGTTGIKTVRICNPVKLGLNQDPAGRFIRRWLPELAPVPDAFVHEPWKWPAARRVLGARYPEPVVDPAAAARDAREKIFARQRMADSDAHAARIMGCHASRKERATPRPRPDSGGAQLLLDL